MADGVFEQLVIRSYRASDFDDAVSLNEAASLSTGMGPETGDWATDITDIVEAVNTSGGELLLGRLEDDLVVMGGFTIITENLAEIRRMRVKPELQGQGVGRKFLGLLERHISDKPIRSIVLGTTGRQVGAQHLYTSAGYTEVSRLPVAGQIHIRYVKPIRY